MTESALWYGLIALACFFTWLSFIRPDILLRMAASLMWMALAFWLLIGGIAVLPLDESWTKILGWVFVILIFVPLIAQINTEIRHESGGHSWTTWGTPPEEEETNKTEEYKEHLRRRWRR